MRIQMLAKDPADADDDVVFGPGTTQDRGKPLEKYNVLLVENDDTTVSTLRALFRAYGCHFNCAESSLEAVDLLNQKFFDLVVTNRTVGGQYDGVDILKKAKKMNPATLVSIFPQVDHLNGDELLSLKLSVCVDSLDMLGRRKL